MAEPTVKACRLSHALGNGRPRAATSGSAGIDLVAAIEKPVVLAPGSRQCVATGWAFEIPAGWEGQVRPRSGLALEHGVTVANSPGTIDSDYRGEIRVILIHLGDQPYTVSPGDRIAQLIFSPVARLEIEVVEELSATDRGSAGFGSSGR